MLKVYLTRHGETKWNKENRLQGSMDSELTEIGIENTVKLGERIKGIDFDAIYSSPSGRAFQTAKKIRLNKDIPIYKIESLSEIHFGDWEGRTREEIEEEERFKNEFHNFWDTPQNYNHQSHNGGGLIAFKKRVETAVRGILSNHREGNILIVTHAVVIRAILSFTMSIPIERMWDPPFIQGTSLTIFNWDGEQFNFEMIGDISHFKNIEI